MCRECALQDDPDHVQVWYPGESNPRVIIRNTGEVVPIVHLNLPPTPFMSDLVRSVRLSFDGL